MSETDLKPIIRDELLSKLEEDTVWDVVVIGGGATGMGIAVDAASRGLKTVLLEAQDFSQGTSSRSTKLIHGGVRYMKNPRDWGLVREALKERRILIKNAPHLVHSKPFILPCYKKYEREFYTVGLGIYSAMTYGGYGIGKTSSLSREDTLARLPGVKEEGLMGGVQFYDGQFDDARLCVALMRTAFDHGAVCLNYMPVTEIDRQGGMIQSVTATDKETGKAYKVRCRMVFNAAGAWVDPVRRLVDPESATLVRVSRGSHIILDKSFMPGSTGMLIPKTRDGRVLFAIPWHGMLLVGTTDVEQKEADFNPEVSEEEIDFMIETASGYLAKPITRADVKASFAGLRPLYNPQATGSAGSTAKVSREHSVIPEFGNMITVTGGKWTAYRKMAEHAMLVATMRNLIPPRLCCTKDLPIYKDPLFDPAALEIAAEAGPEADDEVVRYAIHVRDTELARNAEDVLFRRLRLGQMNTERTNALMGKVQAALEGREYVEPVCPECGKSPCECKAEEACKAGDKPAEEPADKPAEKADVKACCAAKPEEKAPAKAEPKADEKKCSAKKDDKAEKPEVVECEVEPMPAKDGSKKH